MASRAPGRSSSLETEQRDASRSSPSATTVRAVRLVSELAGAGCAVQAPATNAGCRCARAGRRRAPRRRRPVAPVCRDSPSAAPARANAIRRSARPPRERARDRMFGTGFQRGRQRQASCRHRSAEQESRRSAPAGPAVSVPVLSNTTCVGPRQRLERVAARDQHAARGQRAGRRGQRRRRRQRQRAGAAHHQHRDDHPQGARCDRSSTRPPRSRTPAPATRPRTSAPPGRPSHQCAAFRPRRGPSAA